MKKILLLAAVVAALGFSSCRTTEANYRAAYEKAKEKQYDTGDSLSALELKNESLPKDMNIGGVTLPVRTEPLGVTKEGGGEAADLKLYNVVAGTFRQRFNAVSMAQRLSGLGYGHPFVVHNRLGHYYVVAGSVSTPVAAKELLDSLTADNNMVLQAPFPYVLRAAHLVR